MKSKPIPCNHPEVLTVRTWNPYRLTFVSKCTSCHEVLPPPASSVPPAAA